MGKLSRQRRLKTCDPFYRGPKPKPANADLFNLEPKGENDQDGKTNFMDRQLQITSSKIEKKKTEKKKQVNPKMQKLPGETNKKFFSRLDVEVRDALEKTYADTKKVRDKRKKHLKQRDEKVKDARLRKKTESSIDEFKKDVVEFGEVVNEPPQLKFKPRKATGKTNDRSSLHLSAILNKSKCETNAVQPSATLKRKHMSVGQKAQFDKSRLEIIETYRNKKKMDSQKMNLGKTNKEKIE